MQVGSALDVAGYIEALERAKTELAQRERLAALGELAAIIAHEVRNPLGATYASVGGLRKLVDHPDGKLVGVIDEETRRLDSIVSDLLTLIVRARREERGSDVLAFVDVIDTGHGIEGRARPRADRDAPRVGP